VEGALIGAAVAILLAVLGSAWRLSGQIKGIQAEVGGLTERLDRVDVEDLRDRVTRLEVRLEQSR
jgi:hypothetical protein